VGGGGGWGGWGEPDPLIRSQRKCTLLWSNTKRGRKSCQQSLKMEAGERVTQFGKTKFRSRGGWFDSRKKAAGPEEIPLNNLRGAWAVSVSKEEKTKNTQK